MLACTPYHILNERIIGLKIGYKDDTHHAIAARLNTHHMLPQIPKLDRAMTGNVTCKIAPGRAFNTMKGATRL